jgi:hemerythrin superfamily protein
MNKFLKITKETDQIRTQNFKDTFEEYYKILGKHNVV